MGLAFIAELRGGSSTARDVREPLATVTASGNHHMLVRGDTAEPATGVPTVETPEIIPDVSDCRFRMLTPGEIGAAMAFRRDYTVLGTKRDQVRQFGNAVTPPAAEWLLRQVTATLA